MFAQPTVAEVETYVAEVRERMAGFPFTFSPNRFGWHARCVCGEGFTESGGATIGRLIDHADTHLAPVGE